VRPRKSQKPHQALAIETAAKLSVNIVLILTAVSTLAKLVPYNLDQRAKLQVLEAEVLSLAGQVDALKTDFDRNFDPRQTINVMQQENIRFNPKQRQVVWLKDKTEQTATTGQHPAPSADLSAADQALEAAPAHLDPAHLDLDAAATFPPTQD
jgi:hypothetical protein